MMSDLQRWVRKDGMLFLKEIGIREGQIVMDFGCNVGHYTRYRGSGIQV
ncbi:hypothetical protein JXI42_04915 [bacterium]|nr:hypothetical protein [bacterium]